MENLNELAQRVHKANEKWWQDPVTKQRIQRNRGELLMLVITELAEACEGERKNLMDDKLPHRKMAEVEMADAYIRLLDYCAGFGLMVKINPNASFFILSNKGESLLKIIIQVGKIYAAFYFNEGEEIGYVMLAIQEYCKVHNYDLMGAFEEKMAYNATRQDHKHEARLQASGKQW